MIRIIRLTVLVMMTFVALSLVIAIARPETGPAEKAVLTLGVVALFVAAVPVRRLRT